MQGAFKLAAKGDLTKFKKWLEYEKMTEYFYPDYISKTEVEISDSCNLTDMNESYIKEMFDANPEVEITFYMIYDNNYVIRYYKKKDTTEYTQDDDHCTCNWCGKIIERSSAECTVECTYDEDAEFYCEKCYEKYLEEDAH